MARKIIDSDFTNTHELKVYRDSEWQEYVAVIRCKFNNRIVADYCTDDKEDAKSTGRNMLARATNCNATNQYW
jgi:hypothetical protein